VSDHLRATPRASAPRPLQLLALALLAIAFALGGLLTAPGKTLAADPVKVVVIVGPVEGDTTHYKDIAKGYVALAKSLGASVTSVMSPYATWSKVKAAAKGANILIYLGHGNGYPSPYGPFAASRRNGMGLNSSYGHGSHNVKYYGQSYMKTLGLARNSVVLLNHLCYASGNSEPGRAKPSRSVAKRRADGYGTGFIAGGARAVFANGHGSLGSLVTDLLTSDKTVYQMFQDDPAWDGARDFSFQSTHYSFAHVWMDPQSGGRYYHPIVGRPNLTAGLVRAG
jgi:hypothetical protein